MKTFVWKALVWAVVISLVTVSCGSTSGVEIEDDSEIDGIAITKTIEAEVEKRVGGTLSAQTTVPTDDPMVIAEIEANEFVETYGFAAAYTNDPDYAAMAVHQNGEQLLAMTESDSAGNILKVLGGVWISPEGEAAVVYLGEDGLPSRAVIGDQIYVYSNYTDNSVDVAIVTPEGQVEVTKEIGVDASLLAEMRSLNPEAHFSRLPGLALWMLPSGRWDLSSTLKLAGLAVGVAICAGGIAAGTALTGVGGVAVGVACLGALINAVSLATPENPALEASGLAVGAFHCGTSIIMIHHLVNCVPLVLDTVGTVVENAQRRQDERSTAVNLAESSLTYGGGAVQVTLTWDNGSDIDLWVTDPSGEQIGYSHSSSVSGGQLDVDDVDGFGPENIFWPIGGAPSGEYLVEVDYYSGSGPANFQILLQVNGQGYNFTGLLNPDQRISVTSFSQDG